MDRKQPRTYSLQINPTKGISFVYEDLTMKQLLNTVTSFDKGLIEVLHKRYKRILNSRYIKRCSMTRFNHLRTDACNILGACVWSISAPDRFERVKLQVTCRGVSLESDWIHLVDAKATKQGMEIMLTEILFTTKPFVIRRKAG